jgi:uncharacterized membrane protein YbhN (UPF0104 family)
VALCLAAVHAPVPLAAPPLVLLAMAVALAVPTMPAGVGTMEVAAVAALALLGIDPERALAFGLVYHATQVIPVTLLGLDGIWLAASLRARLGQAPPVDSDPTQPGRTQRNPVL